MLDFGKSKARFAWLCFESKKLSSAQQKVGSGSSLVFSGMKSGSDNEFESFPSQKVDFYFLGKF